MAYKQRSNGLPFKQMGSTPAKQAKTSGFGPSTAFGGSKNSELVKDKTTNTKKVMNDGAINEAHAAWLVKNKANFEKMTDAEKKAAQATADAKRKAFEATPEYKARRAAIDSTFKMTGSAPTKQTTNSKVINKDNEITIAANKKAAEIGKYGNKAKKTGDYTPAELALIKNPAYQKALSLALDKVMKDNPDTTGE